MEKSTQNLDEIEKKLKTAEEMLKDLRKDWNILNEECHKLNKCKRKCKCNFKTKMPSGFAKHNLNKKNNLRDKNTARVINADELTYFNLQKYMSKHL
jgi:NifB/MoaA-like Fe-S oxidoreductase